MPRHLAHKLQQGFSTLEILMAFLVLSLSITAIVSLVYAGQRFALDNQTYTDAAHKAQGLLEETRASSTLDFNLVSSIATTTDSQDPTYKKSLDVQQLDPWTKQVTSNVTWNGEGNRNLDVQFSTLLTDPQGFSNGASTCSSVLTGDWQNPQILNSGNDHFGSDLLGLTIANPNWFSISDVQAFGNRLYVAVDTTPSAYYPANTFFVFDLSSSTNPSLLWAVDNASTTSVGLSAVAVAGNYAYVANANGSTFSSCVQSDHCAQLQVVDLTTHTFVKSFKVPGVMGSAGQGIGTSIFYSNGYVYLGLAKVGAGSTNGEFNVIDVGGGGPPASPTNPIWKAAYSVGNGVNSIFVKGGSAFIATPNSENMTVLDGLPLNPHRVGGYGNPPLALPDSNGSGSNHGKTITAIGNTVYLGRTYGTNEFYILNALNHSSIVEFPPSSHQDIGTGNLTSVNGLAVRDHLAFLLTNSQFQVWNISNPSSITPWTPHGLTSEFFPLFYGRNTTLGCQGNYFYVGAENSAIHDSFLDIIGPH